MQFPPGVRKSRPWPWFGAVLRLTAAGMLMPLAVHGQAAPCPELPAANFQTIEEAAGALRTLAECLERQMITPVLANLGNDPAIPPEIAALSQQIVVQAMAAPPPHTGPNAVSKRRGGNPAIVVDFYLLNEIMSVSDLAALLIAPLQSRQIQPLLLEVQLDWAGSFSAERRDWLAASKFSLNKFVTSDSMKVVTEWLAPYIRFGAMAFVVLHEVAHHYLGHVDRDPADARESREWEFQADSLATDLLILLRYGLAPIKGYLEVEAMKERVAAQVSSSPSNPSHPAATERLARLIRGRRVEPPNDTYAFVGVLDRGADGRPVMRDVNYPTADLVEEIPFLIHEGQIFGVEWRGGTALLHQRQGDLMATIEVADADSLYPTITIRRRIVGGTDVTRVVGRGIRRDIAFSLGDSIVGIRIGEALRRRPMQLMREALARAGIAPEVASRAEQVGAANLRETRAILLRFYRGEIDTPEMMRLGTRAELLGQQRLEDALGMEAYRRFRSEMMNDPLVKGVLGDVP